MKKSYSAIITLLLFAAPALAQVDYPTQIQPIFNASCNNCHGGGQNSFNSSSYDAVMASVSPSNRYNKNQVIAGDPDGSPLVDKIEPDPQFGSQMPQGGQLTQNEINLIRTWISEGANAVATNSEVESELPDNFKLIGNFPNPFNPGTQISFEVPVATQYTILIYSMQGQLVSELVGNTSAGRVQVPVNLSNSPTGTYIYRITAQNNGASRLIGTGQMTLIK